MTNKIIGIVAVVALLLGGYALYSAHKNLSFGSPGGDFYSQLNAHNNISVGGGALATTSQGASTLTASQVVGSRLIEETATAALTVTLPTAAQLGSAGFLPNVGDTQSLYFYATTTNVTIAAGAGINLVAASSTIIDKGTMGEITFTRLGTSAADGKAIQAVIKGN